MVSTETANEMEWLIKKHTMKTFWIRLHDKYGDEYKLPPGVYPVEMPNGEVWTYEVKRGGKRDG